MQQTQVYQAELKEKKKEKKEERKKERKKESNSQEVCIHAYLFLTDRFHSPIEDASYIISHFRFYRRERKI